MSDSTDTEDLTTMSVPRLKALARVEGLRPGASATRPDLIERIRRHRAATPVPGIHPKPEPCWILHDTDGKPVGVDFPTVTDEPQHFASFEDAAKDAQQEYHDGAVRIPVQLDHVCWTATSMCGTRWDEDGEGAIVHMDSREEAIRTLGEAGFGVSLSTGDVVCPASWDCGCREAPF